MYRFQIFILFFFLGLGAMAQDNEGTNFSIYYSSPREYTIADIQVVGVKYLDTNVLVQISGLAVGDEIMVPGDEINNAIKKLWGNQMFSDVRIEATKVADGKIWLTIYLQERPRLAGVNFYGVSKSEEKDIKEKVLLLKGSQVTDNQLVSAERIITGIFTEKGYSNAEVHIVQRDDSASTNNVYLDVRVDKKEKVKVQEVVFHGVENLNPHVLDRAMKKTNSKNWRNFFRTKKFSEDLYVEDKASMITKFNEEGYRDATITADSITPLENGRVRVDLYVEEGDKYYFGDIKWLGNTVYPADYLDAMLGLTKGDVFDQSKLDKRLTMDDDAVGNLYLDNGYLFYNLEPVEASIKGDTINYEMRIYEGNQATINNVFIEGNTKTNEHVARRELRTYPGDLFSKSNIIRSVRELSQLGHFDPEAIEPDVQPHPESGTVDIGYKLQEKSNDQIELSGGWGAGQFVGTLGLRFSNFSVRNVFNKEAWSPLPTGDGQTLSLRAQTSGKFYSSYGFSFVEPWLGGKKPNSLSISFNRSRTNYSANNSMYDYSTGYNYYDYGSGYYNNVYDYEESSDDEIQITTAFTVGYGYRMKWPDDFFTVYHQIAFERYKLHNMADYYSFLGADDGANGEFNNLSFLTAISRNSVDQPLYPRTGSEFGLSVQFTFPYSLVNGVDYNKTNLSSQDRYRWIEYHKWKFNGTWYTPISKNRNLVLMTRFEYGFLGYYNKNRRSPFEGFRVGGSGMSGYSLYGTDIVALRGYRDYSLSPQQSGSNIYDKVTVELRYPITLSQSATIYVLGFLEGGNAWMDFENFNPFDVKRSAGVGVRLFLPMFGLMGFDYGYGFDPINGSMNASGNQFHFTIGQQF
ncbi:MAG: outer membrane protein assembly factor BamA [Mangrovibacterium sp.]